MRPRDKARHPCELCQAWNRGVLNYSLFRCPGHIRSPLHELVHSLAVSGGVSEIRDAQHQPRHRHRYGECEAIAWPPATHPRHPLAAVPASLRQWGGVRPHIKGRWKSFMHVMIHCLLLLALACSVLATADAQSPTFDRQDRDYRPLQVIPLFFHLSRATKHLIASRLSLVSKHTQV